MTATSSAILTRAHGRYSAVMFPERDFTPAAGAETRRRRRGLRTRSKVLLISLPLLSILMCCATPVALRTFVISTAYIPSDAMAPTLEVGDRILVQRFGGVDRGDIVVFTAEFDGREDQFVTRLIGLAGDTIECRDGRVHRNGTALDEPYAQGGTECKPVTVPAGSMYALGDNRAESADSRVHGCYPMDAVIGRVLRKFRL